MEYRMMGMHFYEERMYNSKYSIKEQECSYKGKETSCPNQCNRCAIAFKDKGDDAFTKGNLEKAIKLYKKSLFLSPSDPQTWTHLGLVYECLSDNREAIKRYEEALRVNSVYLHALDRKAVLLRILGYGDEALEALNIILENYRDYHHAVGDKEYLIEHGLLKRMPLGDTIKALTKTALAEVIKHHLDKDGEYQVIQEIYQKEEFAKNVFKYCNRCYTALGDEKVRAETCIKAFYGSLVITLLYYRDPEIFSNQSPVQILMSSYDLEKIDSQAEKMLSIQGDEAKKEALWNVIYDFANYATDMAGKVWPEEDRDAAVLDAAESAYVMGMLYAMRWQEANAEKQNSVAASLSTPEPEQTAPRPKARFCHKCGTELIEGSLYCSQCGAKV